MLAKVSVIALNPFASLKSIRNPLRRSSIPLMIGSIAPHTPDHKAVASLKSPKTISHVLAQPETTDSRAVPINCVNVRTSCAADNSDLSVSNCRIVANITSVVAQPCFRDALNPFDKSTFLPMALALAINASLNLGPPIPCISNCFQFW